MRDRKTLSTINLMRFALMKSDQFRVYICKKHEGDEDFINKRLDEICSHEKLSAEEVIISSFSR